MSRSAAATIARNEMRVVSKDPGSVVMSVVMPLLVMAFLKPALRYTLVGQGFAGANGSEQVVPGMAVMFTFFESGAVAFSIFREHGWGTWERLRATPARSIDLVVGKVAPRLLVAGVQFALVFGLGALLFALPVRGNPIGLAVVAVPLLLCLASLGVVFAALLRTIQQMNLASGMSSMLFAALGGAFVPISVLPAWAHVVGPATPAYWAMKGFRAVILGGAGLAGVLEPAAVLLAFATGFALLGAARFRVAETKVAVM